MTSCSVKLRNLFLRTDGLPSPDLNPVDYQIWGVMQDRVYQTPVGDVAYLRQCLIDTWNDLSQRIVNDAVDEWRKRLQVCVNKKGHFEHLL